MMFNAPRYVIKSGVPIIDNHEFIRDYSGRLLHIAPEYDESIEKPVKSFFESYYSVQFENYAVKDDYLQEHEVIPTVEASS